MTQPSTVDRYAQRSGESERMSFRSRSVAVLISALAALVRAVLAVSLTTALMVTAGCDGSAQNDLYKHFSPEAREIMENRELTPEQELNLRLVEIDYAQAAKDMRAIAHKIVLGETLEQSELRALGERIDKSYPVRAPDGLSRSGRTLLITAIENHNLAAIDALLAAGADPYVPVDPDYPKLEFASWNFLFIALRQQGEFIREEDHYDWTYTNQILELYLRHGGDPNYRFPFGGTPLLVKVAGNNFDGFKMLLTAGADPWVAERDGSPFLVELVSLSGTRAHQFIRYLAEHGYYDKVPDQDMEEIIEGATRKLDVGVRTDPADLGNFFYDQFGYYADAVKLIIERSGYALPRTSKLYRLLYVDGHLYRR